MSEFVTVQEQVASLVAKLREPERALGLEDSDAARELPPLSTGHVEGDEGYVWSRACFAIIGERAKPVQRLFKPRGLA